MRRIHSRGPFWETKKAKSKPASRETSRRRNTEHQKVCEKGARGRNRKARDQEKKATGGQENAAAKGGDRGKMRTPPGFGEGLQKKERLSLWRETFLLRQKRSKRKTQEQILRKKEGDQVPLFNTRVVT